MDAIEPIARPGRGRPRKRPVKLHADKAYDTRKCREALRRRNIKSRIASKVEEGSEKLGRHRWVVEDSGLRSTADSRYARSGRPAYTKPCSISAANRFAAIFRCLYNGTSVAVRERGNDQWLAALRGPKKDEALAELRAVLVRGLRGALGGQVNRVESSVEDFAQEALIKILDNLDSFRGESRFTVWAQKVCVRTAFAEMRRRRWRDVSLEEVISRSEERTAADPQLDPERTAIQTAVMAEFRRFIDEELTDRQRTAVLATLGGMPLEAVADRMGTNRNALYKLLHDARKRLKRRMEAESLSPQDVLNVFGG